MKEIIFKNYRPFKSLKEFGEFMESLGNVQIEFNFKDEKQDSWNTGEFTAEDEEDYQTPLVARTDDGETYDAQWLFDNLFLTINGQNIPFGVERENC